MTSATSPGVPTTTAVAEVADGDIFARMEKANSAFLSDNADALTYYRQTWVSDPLHNWSRRWEYPFIYENLAHYLNGAGTVLDAGAGATFFPFFVADALPETVVVAIDYDPRMRKVYDAVSHPRVEFEEGDITRLDAADGHFDAAYSVSVLEHISERQKVVTELARVLKPGAPLIYTMDVSLDGKRDVPVDDAQELLRLTEEHFEPVGHLLPLREAVQHPNALVTTRVDPSTLPWRWTLRGRLRVAVREHRAPWRPIPPITVHGSVWRRR